MDGTRASSLGDTQGPGQGCSMDVAGEWSRPLPLGLVTMTFWSVLKS